MRDALTVAAMLWIACSLPAAAFEDPDTGLTVSPPAPYVAEQTLRDEYLVTVGILPGHGTLQPVPGDRHLCLIGYNPVISNADFTQAGLNELVESAEYAAMLRGNLGTIITVLTWTPFELNGVSGLELTGPVVGATYGSLFISRLETPKGKVVMSCAILTDALASALAELRAIRSGITPPS